MPPRVLAAATLTNGLSSTFTTAYRMRTEALLENLQKVMDLGLPSEGAQELYAYYEKAPYPRRWDRGDGIPKAMFASKGFSVTNYDYALRISWHKNDRSDDRTRSLFDQAQAGGQNWASLKERFFFEVITGTPDLLPSIPNAPDGVPTYNAVDGDGDPRFGVTGGNIVTGGGVATGQQVRTDFWKTVARFKQFKDTEGQPLWDRGVLDGGYMVVYAAEQEEVFREAFLQGRTHSVVSTTGAAVTNTILESGLSIDLWSTQRLSGADWYVFAISAQHKAVFEQERQGIEEHARNMDNSDLAAEYKEEAIQWDSRHGVGAFLPYQTQKVDN